MIGLQTIPGTGWIENMYKCLNCGKEVDIKLDRARKIQCPHCGYRILRKMRPKLTKRVEAQ